MKNRLLPLVGKLGVCGVLASMAAAWDLSLLTNCQVCNSTTQPACMLLLETANGDSSYFDPVFASEVTCSELEFAFECVLLENSKYADGYLDYYFTLTGNSITDCETYANVYDTKKCNVECFEAGGDVQEGAMEFFCEQCTEQTVEDCYYYLGYSTSDSSLTCESKQLALDCLTTSFGAYPNGYLAWMSSQRNDITCSDIANSYSDASCTLHCGECPSTCLYHTCDKWVADGVNTCAGLELTGCDCSGCGCSAGQPAPAPGSDSWIVQETTKCGRGGDPGENQLAIGEGGTYFDTVDNQNFFVSDCKIKCENDDNCGGFSLEFGTTQECWYVEDTRLYVEQSTRESCYTYRVNASSTTDLAAEVAKCSTCDDDTSLSDCMSLVDNAYDYSWDQTYSGFCSDLQTALDCVTAGSTDYPTGYLQSTTSMTCDAYLDTVNTGLCSPRCNSQGDTDLTVDWCTTCRSSTVGKCFEYLTAVVHDATTSCTDLSAAMTCLNSQDYFTANGLQCATTLSAIDASCGLTCPDQCEATCNYLSCDDIIGLSDVVTCAQMENAWGCDCGGCSCSSSSAKLNSLGYRATVGTSCYFDLPTASDNNRATIAALSASIASGVTVDDCAAYCGDEPSVCGGFSYSLADQECVFVKNASRLGSSKGQYLCLENTGEPFTTTTMESYDAHDDGDDGPDVAVIGGVIGGIVVVGVVVAVVVWKVNDANKLKNTGFSPKHIERPTTYAAPPVKTPDRSPMNSNRHDNLAAIDEDRQIDQDGFEL